MSNSRFHLAFLALLALVVACGPSGRGSPSSDCQGTATRCLGQEHQTCQNGSFTTDATCPMACDDTLGCVVCAPGTGSCQGDTSLACDGDGMGFSEVYCDPIQGMHCEAGTGVCAGACSPASLGSSYIGCEYFPTITGNYLNSNFQFAVAIANTSSEAATVTIEDGALGGSPLSVQVAPASVSVQRLPWVFPLKMCSEAFDGACHSPANLSALALGGAYHLRSTVPVTVYQFNPLDYTLDGGFTNSYSNDASLLLPFNAWGKEYVSASYQTIANHPGLLAITAARDGTMVTITPRVGTEQSGGAPAFVAGTPQSIGLNAGDVLELGAIADADLTGSIVTSDKPVQVIGGHYCANMPGFACCCDHIEESIFPVDVLSTRYVITPPAVVSLPQGKAQLVRVVATQANTTLTYDPPVPGAPTSIASAGDFVEMPSQLASFLLTADHKVLVAQYMESQDAGGGTGDPAMSLAVPVDQFRDNYLFHAPINYVTNYVDVVAPTGTTVTLDGAPITGWSPIGGSGFSLARVTPLGAGPQANGNHAITGSAPFSISVYGYGDYTSYWYPGGLDLKNIPVE
jgi:hypothetical protein